MKRPHKRLQMKRVNSLKQNKIVRVMTNQKLKNQKINQLTKVKVRRRKKDSLRMMKKKKKRQDNVPEISKKLSMISRLKTRKPLSSLIINFLNIASTQKRKSKNTNR
jgi:hypothetical protein